VTTETGECWIRLGYADHVTDEVRDRATGAQTFLGVALVLLATITVFLIAPVFRTMRGADVVVEGAGVSRVAMLSDYFPPLVGTAGDTPVYVLEGDQPGGTVLVLGGTHGDEIAGVLAAVVLVENGVVEQGRLFVIPRANQSAATHSLPMEGAPQYIKFTLENGEERAFRYGSRLTNPLDQWPDPEVYVHKASGQFLAGAEARNLNRAFPGSPRGTLTEQVAYAITQLIKKEAVDLVHDMHEASPEYPVVNALVSHQRAMPLASYAVVDLMIEGIDLQLEESPLNLRGLSHRELGDATGAYALLAETPNPAQGRLRGRTSETLVKTGIDQMYLRAADLGLLYVPFDTSGHPVEGRVGLHLEILQSLLRSLSHLEPSKAVRLTGIPSIGMLLEEGLGAFLNKTAK